MFKFSKPGAKWTECMCCGVEADVVEFKVTMTVATDDSAQSINVCTTCGMQVLGYLSAIETGIVQIEDGEE